LSFDCFPQEIAPPGWPCRRRYRPRGDPYRDHRILEPQAGRAVRSPLHSANLRRRRVFPRRGAMAERSAEPGIGGEFLRPPSPTRAVLNTDCRYWLHLAPQQLSRTIRDQCGHNPGIFARPGRSAVAGISRRYCDLPRRRGVRADVVADHDGSTSRPAMGSRTGIGHRGHSLSAVAATQPLVNLSPRRAVRSRFRDQANSFSRVLRMHRIGSRRPAGVRMPGVRHSDVSRSCSAGRSPGAAIGGWSTRRRSPNFRHRACPDHPLHPERDDP